MHQIFNIKKINKNRYQIKTTYNQYLVLIDNNKGIGIYMEFENNSNILIKQYCHSNIQTAINYLFKKEIF